MSLTDWLRMNMISQVELARMTGISQSMVSHIKRGVTCSPAASKAISKATGGKVSPNVGPGRGRYAPKGKFNRMIEARERGVSLADIADRFGYKNSQSAAVAICFQKRKMRTGHASGSGPLGRCRSA